MARLSPNQIQKLLNQYLVADYETPINGDIMKAVASRVTDPKSDLLLLPAVDMEDSGPYEIAEPRVITALETYTPSWLQTPRLKRLAEIVSAQAVLQQREMGEEDEGEGEGDDMMGHVNGNGDGHGHGEDDGGEGPYGERDGDGPTEQLQFEPHEEDWSHVNGGAAHATVQGVA